MNLNPRLLDPVTEHRVRQTLQLALREGCTVREAKGEARGYLRALSPAMPQAHIVEAVDGILAEIDPMLNDLADCEPDGRRTPPGQLNLGL
ncbi:hypothetical protein [Teichococcus oryzae]|uniref:Uncharacterized protein n=1 Tax=Teichococcus oryzae TaxID=1608942 RepID=A0A5B2TBY7_9PROT|nr:hypothetical protein [Pseudoroseomonas oryzae]KAA2211320.1 hypothetical protein F0Q34_20740 [Pseudoroseomonas oryzae]